MASATDVIKSFLISLGWQHDEASRKKVVEAEHKTTEQLREEQKKRDEFLKKQKAAIRSAVTQANLLSDAIKKVSTDVIASLEEMAKGFERLYYSSSRTGSSVKNLQAFQYAASQTGSSAEEASAAVEGLAQAQRKLGHGYDTMLRGLGATDPRDTVKALEEIAPKLGAMPTQKSEAYRELLGIPENLLEAWRKRLPEFQAFEAESRRKSSLFGINPDQAAEDGKKLTQLFRDLQDTVGRLRDSIASKLFTDLKGPLKELNDFLLKHGDKLSDMAVKIGDALVRMLAYVVEHLPELDNFVDAIGGWPAALAAISAVVTAAFVGRMASLLLSLGGLSKLAVPSWLLSLLGVGGVAGLAAAGAAAGGVAALRALPDDQKDQILDRQSALQELRKHHFGGAWNATKQFFGFDKPSANDQLWLRSRQGQEALRASKGPWNKGSDLSLGSPGKLSDNQKEAYAAARGEGLSETAARALVANMSGEGLAHDAHRVHWDGSHYAHGIVQWDDVRSAAIKKQFGKMPEEMSVAEQTKAAIWEIRNNKRFAATNEALRGEHAGAMIDALVRNYESPADKAGAVSTRSRIYQGLGQLGRQAVPTPSVKLKPFTAGVPQGLKGGGYSALGLGADGKPLTPLGVPPVSNDNSKTVHQTNHNTVTVHGVSDPTAAAGQVGARMDRSSSLLLRNMQSAIV